MTRRTLGCRGNTVEAIWSRNSSNTVRRPGIWTEFPLPSVGSPSTGIHNLRPEQELHKHTEHPRDHDQFPSARTHPQEQGLLLSLDAPQHVIREHDKACQRRDLVAVPTLPRADCDGFCCAVISETKPDKSDGDVQEVVAKTAQNGCVASLASDGW